MDLVVVDMMDAYLLDLMDNYVPENQWVSFAVLAKNMKNTKLLKKKKACCT